MVSNDPSSFVSFFVQKKLFWCTLTIWVMVVCLYFYKNFDQRSFRQPSPKGFYHGLSSHSRVHGGHDSDTESDRLKKEQRIEAILKAWDNAKPFISREERKSFPLEYLKSLDTKTLRRMDSSTLKRVSELMKNYMKMKVLDGLKDSHED